MDSFYQAVTSFCFTLMGLWWAVVQFRHDEWMRERDHRRMAYAVYLSFFVPGIMSLGALAGGEVRLVWQVVFSVAGTLGGLSTVLIISSVKQGLAHSWLFQSGRWIALALYAFIVLVALLPGMAQQFVPGLKPLQVESLLLSVLLLLSVHFAWELMAAPRQSN